jgi:hypothetical protein
VLAGACGSSSPRVVRFDVRRRLDASAERALHALSGTAIVTVPDLSQADLMSAVTTPWVGFSDSSAKQTFGRQLAAARAAAKKYANASAAARDGYVLTSYFIPNFGTHWINWSLVKQPFDPARPAMLLYDGDGTNAHLVGLSYYQWSPDAPPAGFAGANDRWHRHFDTCYGGGFLVGENLLEPACLKTCEAWASNTIHAPVATQKEIPALQRYFKAHPQPARSQSFCTFVPAGDIWMLHLWVAAGHANPEGLFSTFNPKVAKCEGLCRTT